MSENDKHLFCLKSLSLTQCAHAEACKAHALNYDCVLQALDDIMNSDLENGESERDARSLMKKMRELETALMCLFWNNILVNFKATNKKLQSPQLDLGQAVKLPKSLKTYIYYI
jgi:hypothetical protein